MIRERRRARSRAVGRVDGPSKSNRLRSELSRQRAISVALLGASQSPMSICVINARGDVRFTVVNHDFCRMLGVDSSDVKGRRIADVSQRMGPQYADLWREIERAVRSGESLTTSTCEFCDDAGRHTSWHILCSPVSDDGGRIFGGLLVGQEITPLQQAAEVVEREMADRMDAFLSLAAHELKTPITSLKGYSQLLLTRARDLTDPRERRAVEAINRQSERINRLINDLLDVTRVKAGQLPLQQVPVDLGAVAKHAVDESRLANNGHVLTYVGDKALVVRGDPDRLEEVVSHLISHAMRYSPAGTKVSVTAQVRGKCALLTVADQGWGVPPHEHESIFKLFHQGHAGLDSGGGMGVGLYTCRNVVERHGGRLWVESMGIPGMGSRFHVSLPLAEDADD